MNAAFGKIPARAIRANLSAMQWAVLATIALHADAEGHAFPSMGRIAQLIGMKRNNVPRAILRLEERGLLRRKRVAKPNGGWQVSHYELVFGPLDDVVCADAATSTRVIGDADTSIEHVIAEEDISGRRAIAATSPTVIGDDDTQIEPVIDADDISALCVISMADRSHQHEGQDVISGDALTEILTDQGTASYQEKKVEEIAQAKVLSPEQARATSSRRSGNTRTVNRDDFVVGDLGRPCGFYVVGKTGYRICNKPSVPGTDRCAEHSLKLVASDVRPT